MAEIINLRQARKTRTRSEKEQIADANRAKFGRSRQERELERKKVEQQNCHLDGHKRD